MSDTTYPAGKAWTQLAAGWSWLLGQALVGALSLYVGILQIVEFNIHKPDVVTATDGPVIALFVRYIQTPFASLIQSIGATITAVDETHFGYALQSRTTALVAASALMAIGGLWLLYNSLVVLLRVYDAYEALASIRNFAFLVVSISLIPLAVLGIVHIVKTTMQIQLIPLANDAVQDYVTITRAVADRFYHLVIPWHVPLWLKDAAAISTISVGINRKAWLRDQAGYYELDWAGFRQWIREMFQISSVFDALELLPQLIAVSLGFVLGRLILLFRWRWLAERVASTVYVLARGVLLVGLIYPFDHLYKLYRFRGNPDAVATRSAAHWYLAFMGMTLALSAWFLLAFTRMPAQ